MREMTERERSLQCHLISSFGDENKRLDDLMASVECIRSASLSPRLDQIETQSQMFSRPLLNLEVDN